MTSIVNNELPPYVTFERRAVEDRNATIAAGQYVAKDVDFALVTRPGSRDTLETEVLPWLGRLRDQAKDNLIPANWVDGFTTAYDRWKAGEEIPVNGTPIKTWPALSPAAAATLIQAGFRTVEDLAAAEESSFSRIGMGALAYKQKAIAWLETANSQGKSAESIAALTQQVAELTALTKTLIAENNALKAKLPSETPAKA